MKKIIDEHLFLSNDPEENMRMENGLLQLKLKAELGAETHLSGNIPVWIENEFMKNVLAFEHNYSAAKNFKVSELLGNPQFKQAIELDDQAITEALQDLIALMNKKQMAIDFIGTYEDRTKYKFIVEELLNEEITDAGIPGMIMHFIYEEFHPNHKMDIETKTMKFISAWFRRTTDEIAWELADEIILPTNLLWSKKRVVDKLKQVFNCYSAFSDYTFSIIDINFELNGDIGMGYAEGAVSYTAVIENHEAISIQGPFKIYFSLEYGWWDIYYFVFPGFNFSEIP